MKQSTEEAPLRKRPKYEKSPTLKPRNIYAVDPAYKRRQEKFFKKYGYYEGDIEGGRSIYSSFSTTSSSVSEAENEKRKAEYKGGLDLFDRQIAEKQKYNYKVAKQIGNPLALSKYFVYSHLPYDEYNPRLPENKDKTLFSNYEEARVNGNFTPEEEHQFVRDYFDAYAIKQYKIRESPWIRHIQRTAAEMKRNKIPFKRGELFKRAARTYTLLEGRRPKTLYSYQPVGKFAGGAVGYVPPVVKKKSPYKRIFVKE